MSESEKTAFLAEIRQVAEKRILFLSHAMSQITHPERMISVAEVRQAIFHGQIIEDYPEDARGHSALLLGFGEANRPLHVVCAPKKDYLAVITAYLPDAEQWAENFTRRL